MKTTKKKKSRRCEFGRLVTLGTGTAVPQPEHGATSLLIHTSGHRLLVDCGSGALQKMTRHGVSLEALDALWITHTHLDHVGDFLPLAFALANPALQHRPPLNIHLSEEAHHTLRGQLVAHGLLERIATCMRFLPIKPGDPFSCGPWEVETRAVSHHITSVGFRARSETFVFAAPGDSGPCAGLIALCEGADLAFLHCALPDANAIPQHLSPSSTLDVLRAARPAHAAIVHRYPELLADDDASVRLTEQSPCPLAFPCDGSQFALTSSSNP